MTPDCGVGQGLVTCYLSAGDVGLLILAAAMWIVLGLAVGLVIGKIAYNPTGPEPTADTETAVTDN